MSESRSAQLTDKFLFSQSCAVRQITVFFHLSFNGQSLCQCVCTISTPASEPCWETHFVKISLIKKQDVKCSQKL